MPINAPIHFGSRLVFGRDGARKRRKLAAQITLADLVGHLGDGLMIVGRNVLDGQGRKIIKTAFAHAEMIICDKYMAHFHMMGGLAVPFVPGKMHVVIAPAVTAAGRSKDDATAGCAEIGEIGRHRDRLASARARRHLQFHLAHTSSSCRCPNVS